MANAIATAGTTQLANAADVGTEPAVIDQPVITLATLRGQPIFRQIGMMVAIAASVAIGVAVVLWSQEPNYTLLDQLTGKDATQVIDVLTKAQIDYKIDQNGQISVLTSKLHKAKLLLAAEGLPKSAGIGYELLDQEVQFGTTRFAENARHRRAQEGELSKSIALLSNVASARVHLAVPRQSVFVRKRKKPSAAVVLKLYPGRSLAKENVQAIVNLVSASVPNLEPGNVTIVDHKGNMLKGAGEDTEFMARNKEQEFKKKIEQDYVNSIEVLLASFLGPEGVRAEVKADMDFSVSENTRETYEPDNPAVRSEQTVEERSNTNLAAGIPGALSNQPPPPPEAPEETGEGVAAQSTENSNFSRRTTRNLLPDHSVTHTKNAVGSIIRLSVAVVIDHKKTFDDNGNETRVPRTQEELTRITEIAKRAIGFDITRGDTINVMNEAFFVPAPFVELPEPPVWEQSWFADVLKQVLAALFVLYLVFGLLRPAMKKMVMPVKTKEMLALEAQQEAEQTAIAQGEGGQAAGADGTGGEQGAATAGSQEEVDEMFKLDAPKTFEMQVKAAREIVKEDPKRVAQVVKKWVGDADAG